MYELTGIIFSATEVDCCRAMERPMVALEAGVSLLPLKQKFVFLTDGDNTEFNENSSISLPEKLKQMLFAFKQAAYVEACFWGGDGMQASVVQRNGAITYGPEIHPGTINAALRRIGVVEETRTSGGKDPFDMVGLGQERSVKSWLGRATR